MEEWGPWTEHDGKGCPCVGMYVQRVISTGGRGSFPNRPRHETEIIKEGLILSIKPVNAWDWQNFLKAKPNGLLCGKIIRYRIRKPRALQELRELVENLPVREDA